MSTVHDHLARAPRPPDAQTLERRRMLRFLRAQRRAERLQRKAARAQQRAARALRVVQG